MSFGKVGKWLAVTAVAAFSVVGVAQGQTAPARDGFWFSGGLGYGSLGCDNCGSREGGISGGLSLGGTITPRFLLGAGVSGWTKSDQGATLTVGLADARVRFYPQTAGGFFLTGGLGLGTVTADIPGFGSHTEEGLGMILGMGYDVRLARNVSVTPFWNAYAMRNSNTNANVGQLGMALTVH
jgi:hypothetical protein